MSGDVSSAQLVVQLVLPVLLGGLTHVACIRLNLFPSLAALPLDGGLAPSGRRLFGANKTVRGALVMISATALWASLLVVLSWATELPLSLGERLIDGLGWGALLGFGYIAGELPNSFLKRRLDIAPGDAARGAWSKAFWVADQIDSLVGVLLLVSLLRPLPWTVPLVLVAVTLVLHPTIALLMVRLGLKSRVG